MSSKDLLRDEEGLTTTSMAVSIMLCLALIFSGAQLYRVSSAASEVQEVADVAAIAAENEVGEFMIAVNLCDAAVLSLTLLSATLYGLAVVAACLPPLEALSVKLEELATKTANSRDRFYRMAVSGLNRLQDLLPLFSAASAYGIAKANNDGAMQASYYGIAVLVPQQGERIGENLDGKLEELKGKVEGSADDIRQHAKDAEEASELANEAKKVAYQYDCGNNPGYCLYERAGRLSGISEADNPFYSSVDNWSFSVPLERARAYYSARIANESPPAGGAKDQASYHLRKRFYSYVRSELSSAYVMETKDSFDAYFPKIFRNVAEFKETPLYIEAVYPVDDSGTMHAYDGCPASTGAAERSSIAALDLGEYAGCTTCDFSVSSMAKIASASTNIGNGFEHHYERIREASLEYKRAMDEAEPHKREVRDKSNSIFDAIRDLAENIKVMRIKAKPPGRSGAISIVANLNRRQASAGFETTFVSGGTTLGATAAVSGATLVEDSSHESASIITSLLDGLGAGAGGAVGAARIALDCWNALLSVYERGQNALIGAVRDGLNSIPLSCFSGLGDWAAKELRRVISSAGLQPASLKAQKAVIVNTEHVASADSGGFGATFMRVKTAALSASSSSTTVFGAISSSISDAVRTRLAETEITIAEIRFPVGDSTFPVKIALPQPVQEAANGAVERCLDAIGSAVSSITGIGEWR